ncbi:hypothetical protein [Paenibacillus assamensis]|uniref:hypothetical protein n=1 Tax=Paenibacillus assamensis TaxID=311244 RepID=UPI000410810A|nr:hypothetical protein [Paenibacillus assamensis]
MIESKKQKIVKSKKVRNLVIVTIIFLLTIGVLVGINSDAIFQEGNPVPLFLSIVKLNFINEEIVQFSEQPEKYVMKIDNNEEIFKKYMREKGWVYQDKLGAGLIFEKNKEKITITSRMYSKEYIIYSIPSVQTQ